MSIFGFAANQLTRNGRYEKVITTFSALKRLFDALEPDFIKSVIAVIWRVIAALGTSFLKRGNVRSHRQTGTTTGTLRL